MSVTLTTQANEITLSKSANEVTVSTTARTVDVSKGFVGTLQIGGGGTGATTSIAAAESLGFVPIFASRALAIANLDSISTGRMFSVAPTGLFWKKVASSSDISDMPNVEPVAPYSIEHWAENTTPGTTDMTAAWKAAISYLGDGFSDITASANASAAKTLSLGGKRVLISSPIVYGQVSGVGSGYIRALSTHDGTVVCDSGGSWDALATHNGTTTVPGDAIVCADYRDADLIDNDYGVAGLMFPNVEIDCGYATGGMYFENTYNCSGPKEIRRIGKNRHGVKTSQNNTTATENVRGIRSKNGALSLNGIRIRGGFREGGDALNSGELPNGARDSLCRFQALGAAGNLTLDGGLVSGGVWTAPGGVAYHLEIHTRDDDNLSDRTFTITGTDANGDALVEAIAGPNGTSNGREVVTENEFLTVTQVAVDGDMGTNEARIGASMNTLGFFLGSADCACDHLNISDCTRGAYLNGFTSGQFSDWHVWSRNVTIGADCSACMFSNVYADYTDYIFYSFDHRITGYSQRGGNPSVILVATQADENGNKFGMASVDCNGGSPVQYWTEGAGTWVPADDRRVTIVAVEAGLSTDIEFFKLKHRWNMDLDGNIYSAGERTTFNSAGASYNIRSTNNLVLKADYDSLTGDQAIIFGSRTLNYFAFDSANFEIGYKKASNSGSGDAGAVARIKYSNDDWFIRSTDGAGGYDVDTDFGYDNANGVIYSKKPIKTQAATVASIGSASDKGAGAIAVVTDATSTTARSTAVGGGSNTVLVFSDGTNWLIGA